MSNVMSNDDGTFKSYKHNGFSSTITDSFTISGWVPKGITWVDVNLMSVNSDNDKHYKHSGFSSTITDSYTSPNILPTGITWDGSNVLSADYSAQKHYKHTGFSSTIADSYASPGSNPKGITWDSANVLSADYSANKHYKHTGFSSTISDSYTSPGTLPYGITWDGTNVLSVSYSATKHYKHTGFSSTVTDSYASPGSNPTGITWDARYAPVPKSSSDTGSGSEQILANVELTVSDSCSSSESSSIQGMCIITGTASSSDEVSIEALLQILETGNGSGLAGLVWTPNISDSGQGNDISGVSVVTFKGITETGSFSSVLDVLVVEQGKWWSPKQKICVIDLNRIESRVNATDMLAPYQSDPPDMKVHVSEGYIYFDEQAYYFTNAVSPTFVVPETSPRWDGLYLDSSGSLKIIQGEEAVSPQKPQFGSSWVPIAYVYHRTSEVSLIDCYDDDSTNGLITDIRKFLSAADMRKNVYDLDRNGIVEDSSTLGGISAINHLLTDGSRKLTDHLDFNGHRAIGLINPSLEQEVATKTYVDTKLFELERSDKVAGETMVFGNIVYLKSDNKWYKASALNYGTAEGLLAIVLSASVGTNESVSVMLLGEKTNILWSFIEGAVLYLGTSLGEITETEPSESGQIKRKIGFARNTNTIYFNPDLTVQEVL